MARYLQIVEDLRSRIVAGAYTPGWRLPSNRELALEYETTLSTLRKALEVLDNQGWIRIEHGNGTFVADIGSHADMLASLSTYDLTGATRLDTRLLGIHTAHRDTEAARTLGLAPEDPIVWIQRLRVIDGRPLILQSSYVADEHAPVVAEYRGDVPLYVFLRERLGLMATRSDEHVVAARLDATDAGLLDQPPGTEVLRARRTSYSFDGDPAVFDDARIVTDRLSLHIRRHGHDVRAVFALTDDGRGDG